jgi:hypothetical protein
VPAFLLAVVLRLIVGDPVVVIVPGLHATCENMSMQCVGRGDVSDRVSISRIRLVRNIWPTAKLSLARSFRD